MESFQRLFLEWGAAPDSTRLLSVLTMLLLLLLAAWLCGVIFRIVITPVIIKIVARTQAVWDDYIFSPYVLRSASHVIPGIVFYLLLPFAFHLGETEVFPDFHELAIRGTQIYVTVTVVRLFFDFFTNISRLTSQEEDYSSRHYLIGITQFLKLITLLVGAIAIVSFCFGESPLRLIAGLGAVATVLLFIFKDTMLGLVAGIQLSVNKMVKPGDWITIDKLDVNGFVEEVSLTTVKIRNFDNTISTLPPYTLVSDSFRNWKGMSDGGGRRVKRALYIDVNSIRPTDKNDVERLKRDGLLPEDTPTAPSTNLTLFRCCIENELNHHPEVNTRQWLMARQLDPTPHGIPVEVYFYFKECQFVRFEHLAADCMEHFIALLPEFGLRAYQAPSGYDFTTIQ